MLCSGRPVMRSRLTEKGHFPMFLADSADFRRGGLCLIAVGDVAIHSVDDFCFVVGLVESGKSNVGQRLTLLLIFH